MPERPNVVAVIPADRYYAKRIKDGEVSIYPVIAWVLTQDDTGNLETEGLVLFKGNKLVLSGDVDEEEFGGFFSDEAAYTAGRGDRDARTEWLKNVACLKADDIKRQVITRISGSLFDQLAREKAEELSLK